MSSHPGDIAMIGCGLRFPGGASNPSQLWDLLQSPRDLASKVPTDRFDLKGHYHANGEYHGHTNVKEAYFLDGKGAHRRFDAGFFAISPLEAQEMDPQARLLLETVYEALEDAGIPFESLRGSDTAIYAGEMLADHEQILIRDLDYMGTYHATGTSRAMLSNRVSYFFDWHGPSMTIDTACSSSLVAVHHAVQQLRAGLSRVAIAAGTNLIFDPRWFAAESSFHMLSPNGRSRMWDLEADGYARGEGVAAVVLKTLDAALQDGDHIDCVIRETGVNQDGKTPGITKPNSTAQSNLIRSCYARAGLDLSNPEHRPQYFEAHGTGTPAGDPIEARAIESSFFTGGDGLDRKFDVLRVGSIKTVVGHSEGAAGLAGLLKVSLALQNATIPPNLHFNKLNPDIEPFYHHLQVQTSATQWPDVVEGNPRRASVNSFGFGGTNAHAIIESFPNPAPHSSESSPTFTPFLFSAACESSLKSYIARFTEYLQDCANVCLHDLAYTLHTKRAAHEVATHVAARNMDELRLKLIQKLHSVEDSPAVMVGFKALACTTDKPRILGIFTGQGAQWAGMLSDMINDSDAVRGIVEKLEFRLSQLPPNDAPSWSLIEELQREPTSSRVYEASIAQPLTTAIQIVQIQLLKASGITFDAVVGHSSGEIAAAVAAGFLTPEDAICIAYYRGLHSSLACGSHGEPGAMLAVGASIEDVQGLINCHQFKGLVCIAAVNSPSNLTLSGDKDAIAALKVILEEQKRFVRLLKVDKAYHSHHMAPCSHAYLQSLAGLGLQVGRGSGLFSSVTGKGLSSSEAIHFAGSYWEENMRSPVLFMDALLSAWHEQGPFDLLIEIGPHPALKGPVLQTLVSPDESQEGIPYVGLLNRGSSAVQSVADTLGYVSVHFGRKSVDLNAYNDFVSGNTAQNLVKGLPTYAWNHDTEYWHESRYAKAIRTREDPVHELLGHKTPDTTEEEMHWRHFLSPREIPWLMGHQLESQIVFPAAGYIVMAVEAAMELCRSRGQLPVVVEVLDVDLRKALTFDQETSMVEVLFCLTDIVVQRNSSSAVKSIVSNFTCNSASKLDSQGLSLLAKGSVKVQVGISCEDALPARPAKQLNLAKLDHVKFYDSMSKLGYQYTGPFSALTDLERKSGAATGCLSTFEPSPLIIHPATLDAAFQSIILIHSSPGDGRFSTIQIPRKIRSVAVSIALLEGQADARLPFDTEKSSQRSDNLVTADIHIYSSRSDYAMIQVMGLEFVPLNKPTIDEDKALFGTMVWDVATPTSIPAENQVDVNLRVVDDAALTLERMAHFYLRNLEKNVPHDHRSRVEGPYVYWYKFAASVIAQSRAGSTSLWRDEWDMDTAETISHALKPFESTIDVQLLKALGEKIVHIATGTQSPVEIGMKDGLLERYYSHSLGWDVYSEFLVMTIGQIAHRYPRMDIFEIGAGTGGTTKLALKELRGMFSSYTFTDISAGFFDSAKVWAEPDLDKMTFKTFDAERAPSAQGITEHSYDLVIGTLVLHATRNLEHTLRNTRRLLRPGGYLLLVELIPTEFIHYSATFGAFPGWWLGAGEGRISTPGVSLDEWNGLLLKTGFSGFDSLASQLPNAIFPAAVFTSQAVDDKISFLRNPLSAVSYPFKSRTQDLFIIGGNSIQGLEIKSSIEALLRSYGFNARSFDSFKKLAGIDIAPTTTILSLVDVYSPFFEEINEPEWNGLKSALQKVETLVWVSQGRRTTNAYSCMMVGLVRSARCEIPTLDYLFLDIENKSQMNATTISEAILRHKATKFWRSQDSNLVVSLENELIVDEAGQYWIPRLQPSKRMNDRYNSSSRLVTAPIEGKHLRVDVSNGEHTVVEHPASYPLDLVNTRMEVSHSVSSALRIGNAGFAFVVFGKSSVQGERLLVLSTIQESAVQPWGDICVSVNLPPESYEPFLSMVAKLLVSFTILFPLAEGERVLVHEPDYDLAMVLSEQARLAGIQIVFTTQKKISDPEGIYQTVHPYASDSVLSDICDGVTGFVDLCQEKDNRSMTSRFHDQLPPFTRRIRYDDLFSSQARLLSPNYINVVRDYLEKSAMLAQEIISREHRETFPKGLTIEELSLSHTAPHPFSVIRWSWTSKALSIVQPAGSLVTLRHDRTYWLVGLSGDLGLSLCGWMVRHGARNIVISSRKPDISSAWQKEMLKLGANIKITSCDVTDKSEVNLLYNEIVSEMPPVAGVAQGAMVLQDVQVQHMTLDALLAVTQPKVEGSIHLDSLFQDSSLDFFVFFSSAISINGNPGQSAYSAANMFMVGLAEKRRRRGLAASVIHIGPIFGVGYLARNAEERALFPESRMTLDGYIPGSEFDLHQLFAEALLSGLPGTSGPVEIVLGLRQADPSIGDLPSWESKSIMSQYIRCRKASKVLAVDSQKIPLKKQLLGATNFGEICTIVQKAFTTKVRSLFNIPSKTYPDNELAATRLDKLGIDSLSAIEVRKWFMHSIEVNIPILKLLSGATIGELASLACKELPSHLGPKAKHSNSDAMAPHASNGIVQKSRDASSKRVGLDHGNHANGDHANGDHANGNHAAIPLRDITKNGVTNSQAFFRLSFSQEMFWFVWSYLNDKTSLNHTGWVKITAQLRIDDFKKAIRVIGQRHETLRTSFRLQNGLPYQIINHNSTLELHCRDIQDIGEVSNTAEGLRCHVFDVGRGETIRLILLSISAVEHYLVCGLHALVMDGISFQIFLDQVMTIYTHGQLHPEQRQFVEYSEAQRNDFESGRIQSDLSFWHEEFATPSPILPILNLSPVSSRPDLAIYETERIVIRINLEIKEQIKTICRQYGATPFHFYLAVFRTLLKRYAPDADEVTIGVGDGNRTEHWMMDIIGPIFNILPVRLKASGSMKFDELLQNVRSKMYTVLAHSKVPFQVLLNQLDSLRSSTYSSLFQCFIDYRIGQWERASWGDVDMQFMAFENLRLVYDISLDIFDHPDGESVHIIDLRKDLYDATAARLFANSYEMLVEAFASAPTHFLQQPKIFNGEDVEKSLSFSQGPRCSLQWAPLTTAHIIHQVARTRPHDTAIINFDGTARSYSALYANASRVSARLQALGLVAESPVAVLLQPSSSWIASILGIWWSGLTYLPLDLGLPLARLSAMIKDAQPPVILVDRFTKHLVDEVSDSRITVMDVSWMSSNLGQLNDPPILCREDQVAVILYTSGSTSTPKGILIKHRNLSNWAETVPHSLHLGSEIVLQQTSSTFDLSLLEILVALCHGGTLCPVPCDLRGDVDTITRTMRQYQITFTCATPSEYRSWLRFGRQEILQCSQWKIALSIGEMIPSQLVSEFSSLKMNSLQFWNQYGPTEACLSATGMQVNLGTVEEGLIAAGRPLPNYSIYVLDDQMRILPPTIQGEVYIGGAGVVPGYLGRDELTNEKFLPNAFASTDEHRKGWSTLHRTGDVGRWKEDGNLVIEGRVAGDTQIRLRGLRIDLREIEDAIIKASNESVAEVAVSLRNPEKDEDTLFLVAHVVRSRTRVLNGLVEDPFSILTSMAALPRYMCPSMIIPVDALPKTNSAKLDRKAVALLELPRSLNKEDLETNVNFSRTEASLMSIWMEIMLVNRSITTRKGPITRETDFFHVGGNSLLLLELQSRIQKYFDSEVSILSLFKYSTLGAMALLIDNSESQIMASKVDWEKETELQEELINVSLSLPIKSQKNAVADGKVVALTGATGLLGREILHTLLANPGIRKIHCLGVRSSENRDILSALENVAAYKGDLGLPQLGLSDTEAEIIFNEADFVIHSGADVSYIKTYESLRGCNLQSTKELVELCAPRMIEIHYVSTVSVWHVVADALHKIEDDFRLDDSKWRNLKFGPVSATSYQPLPPSSNDAAANAASGYIATKWASERYLERVGELFPDWPISIHRPSVISSKGINNYIDPNSCTDVNDHTISSGFEISENIKRYSTLLRAIPNTSGGNLSGAFNIVPLKDVVAGILGSISKADIFTQRQERSSNNVRYFHHLGSQDLELDDLRSWAIERGSDKNPGEPEAHIEVIALDEWAQRAAAHGMNPILVAMLIGIARTKGHYTVPRGLDRSELSWKSPFQPYAIWVSLFFLVLSMLTSGYKVFLHDHWATESFISSYINIPIFLVLYRSYKFINGTKIIPLAEIPIHPLLEHAQRFPEPPEEPKQGWKKLNIFWN